MSTIPTAEETTKPPLPTFKWLKSLELGYENNSRPPQTQLCFNCGKVQEKLLKCSRCQVATYCSKNCQISDWKEGVGHKHICSTYKRVGTSMKLESEEHRSAAKTELYSRIRFYVCPYAVHKSKALGKGFIFIQSDCTLAEVSLMVPKNAQGHAIPLRSVLVHFLTIGEYDSEVCRDDFELAEVRSTLQDAIDSYDEKSKVVILMRFRCGHVSLGLAELVPEYNICSSLGRNYYEDSTAGALQLNLDQI